MKKFIIGLLKGIGYFGIYFAMQILVSTVYSVIVVVPVVMEYMRKTFADFQKYISEIFTSHVLRHILDGGIIYRTIR